MASDFNYRAARDRIFGLVRNSEGSKVVEYQKAPGKMNQRALLLALVEFAPNIEPSTTALASMLNTDERVIRRLIRSCEASGLLVVERRDGQRSRYTITCLDPGQIVPPDAESPRTNQTSTPDYLVSLPRTNSPPKQTIEADNKAGCAAGAAPASKSKFCPLPGDWSPTPEHLARARDLGLNAELERQKFRSNAKSRGLVKADWNEAFTGWLLNAPSFSPRSTTSLGGTRGAALTDEQRRTTRNNLFADAVAGRCGKKAQAWAESGEKIGELLDKLEQHRQRQPAPAVLQLVAGIGRS